MKLMTRRPLGAAALALAALLLPLAACSDEPDERQVTLDGSSSPDASEPTGSPTQAPSAQGPEPATEVEDGRIVPGVDKATTAEERAVTQVWFDFWAELGRLYTTTEVDRAALGALASGPAFEGPVAYAERMQASGTSNTGGAIASVVEVEVEGQQAVVSGCVHGNLIEVDAQGLPVEPLQAYTSTRETLEFDGGAWRVVKHEGEGVHRCDHQ